MNAKQEILEHIKVAAGGREVVFVHVAIGAKWEHKGPLADVVAQLDFIYNNGYGCQELFGTIWYADGTWSERGEYDGSEWWEFKKCPDLPDNPEISRSPAESAGYPNTEQGDD